MSYHSIHLLRLITSEGPGDLTHLNSTFMATTLKLTASVLPLIPLITLRTLFFIILNLDLVRIS